MKNVLLYQTKIHFLLNFKLKNVQKTKGVEEVVHEKEEEEKKADRNN